MTRYYGARSNEFGYANYEIIPAPQIAENPLTALSNQFSSALGLTEQQRQQIVPMLQGTIKKLTALKNDTSVTGLKKVEQLKQVADSFVDEVKPLLNADQQQKFDGVRDQLRERVLERVGAAAIEKAEAAIRGRARRWHVARRKSRSDDVSPRCGSDLRVAVLAFPPANDQHRGSDIWLRNHSPQLICCATRNSGRGWHR